MIFKRFTKLRTHGAFAETKNQKFFRYFIVICLFLLAFWGVAQNSAYQKQLAAKKHTYVSDATQTLPNELMDSLEKYTLLFKKTYGIVLFIRIYEGPLPHKITTHEQIMTATFELSPSTHTVCFQGPPLMKAAIGKDLTDALQGSFFAPYFANKTWPEGLVEALNQISAKLDASLATPN